MKKITLINAYGYKNIGDAAILQVAIDLIKEAFRDYRIEILCESTDALKNLRIKGNIKTLQLPYGYAIDSKGAKVSGIVKGYRLAKIFFISYILITLNILLKKDLVRSGFFSYIRVIKDADVVIGMGGGYFTTNGMRDYFGLLLTLLPIHISKIYGKKITFLPISFGPFAYKHQEYIAYYALKDTTIMARDTITLRQLQSNDTDKGIKLTFAPDLALFLKTTVKNTSKKLYGKYIALTARQWFIEKIKQQHYEDSLKNLIEYIWAKHKLKTVFIPMANNKIEDNDNEVASRLLSSLDDKNLLKIVQPKNPSHVQDIIAKAEIAVCTRMHSAILATTVFTPFIAIGYGHKTLGLVQNLGLEKWHIDIEKVGSSNLIKLFEKLSLNNNYSKFIEKVKAKQASNAIYKDRIINIIRTSY